MRLIVAGRRIDSAETRLLSDARFDRLLQEHDAVVRRLAHSYERDPARRQDLVQDIWLAVWQALPRFRGEASERTFVFLGLRQVVVLTLEGLSHAEVADIVGISENNVAVRMTRARSELTRLLGAGGRRT